ncbi:aminotransferase [Flexivirga endophytica]|uniref:Aminotransferase n=1 Tax=Flexivirga endophytica TaxID=1849103 RepID=A0A916T039_9MICO|nr:type 1 glutamine amidotransferase [Flexivirga endophytica]GGB26077.1 aminotransferase [Flexivirga endophytica]GHB54622.1 aminotransferase [Flexivirga endophytica]
MPTVLVIQPGDDDPLGRFDGWLEDRGVAIQTIRPYDDDAVPDQLTTDGLIVLGGDMSSNDDASYPWLEDIRVLLRDAARQEAPTLGICLGGQLLAQALGGSVVRGGTGVEAGLVTASATDEAPNDLLFNGIGPDYPVASMHGDVIEALPEGAVLLGTGATYPHQAFRAAPNAWGVQFHPEISPATYAEWAGAFHSTDADERTRVARGIDDLAAADPAVLETSALLAERFAGLVTDRSSQAGA